MASPHLTRIKVSKGHNQDSVPSTEPSAWIPLRLEGDLPSPASVDYCQRCAIHINKCCGSDTVVTPALGRQRQENQYIFKASLIYTGSSRQTKLHSKNLPQDKF